LVRAVGDHLELIAGERRWRAAQLAGLNEVPVLIRVATDAEVLEMALIENLQRENLNPIEEALGYQQLQAAFRLTQEQIAAKVGRGRVVVANAMRLLKLPPNVQTALKEGQLSVGHAKVLLGIADPTLQIQAAKQVIEKGLTVRQTEDFVARLQAPPPPPPQPPTVSVPDPHVLDMENRLRERFTAKVALRYQAGKGSVELRFHNDEELHRLLALLGVPVD
jgi:ParB family chromosome partitioning protein